MARKGQGIEILTGWQAGIGGEDFLRQLVERTVQQVLEAEMTSFLGAETYERNGERRGWRNGYKPRSLKTRVGELELMVPKDRDGEFQTELFERYQRSEKAFVLALLQMYLDGVSTRKVSAITEALCGLEVSKSQVSALTAKLDAAHRKRMRTTNMLERQNQELKRRTRVVRVFPHEQTCLRLIAALLMETNQEWMGRIYLRMEEEPRAATEVEAAPAQPTRTRTNHPEESDSTELLAQLPQFVGCIKYFE